MKEPTQWESLVRKLATEQTMGGLCALQKEAQAMLTASEPDPKIQIIHTLERQVADLESRIECCRYKGYDFQHLNEDAERVREAIEILRTLPTVGHGTAQPSRARTF